MPGPLSGVRVIELSAIGPVPFGVMLLADLGAKVIRVDRPAAARGEAGLDASMVGLLRGRRSIAIDLKSDDGRDVVLDLVERSDVLVEGWRPGVAERLGLGPDDCAARNPALIYARMTGWGQDGPWAQAAGHDLNYAAITGAIHAVGRADSPPPPPLNLVADFGGGGTYLAIGVLAALLERERSGLGQVVDAAMVDGAASLTAFFHGLRGLGMWQDERAANLLDGGAPFYDCYQTLDGRYVAVGAIEPQFQLALAEGLGLTADQWWSMTSDWSSGKKALQDIFASRTRDDWAEQFAGTDACVTPVLDFGEAPNHPVNVARGAYVDVGGRLMPAPAPRLSRTPAVVPTPPPGYGADTDAVLLEIGMSPESIEGLRTRGVVA